MFNPYTLNAKDLDKRISDLRAWLHTHHNHERSREALLALEHALRAKETLEERSKDEFLNEAINALW